MGVMLILYDDSIYWLVVYKRWALFRFETLDCRNDSCADNKGISKPNVVFLLSGYFSVLFYYSYLASPRFEGRV